MLLTFHADHEMTCVAIFNREVRRWLEAMESSVVVAKRRMGYS